MAVSVQEALEHADWYLRYALDRIGGDGRDYHRGVRGHAAGAQSQLKAALELARPVNDEAVA